MGRQSSAPTSAATTFVGASPGDRATAIRIARTLLDEPWHGEGAGGAPAGDEGPRFRVGVLRPAEARQTPSTPERSFCQTECLIEGDDRAAVDIELRFLQARARSTDGAVEAVDRSVALRQISLAALVGRPQTRWFTFGTSPADGYLEERLDGAIELRAVRVAPGLYRFAARIGNVTAASASGGEPAALRQSMLATHAVLEAHGGGFVSRLDPPPRLREAAARCENIGAWPVLVGPPGARSVLLSSPVMLYDYPRAAAQRARPARSGAPDVDDLVDALASVGAVSPLLVDR